MASSSFSYRHSAPIVGTAVSLFVLAAAHGSPSAAGQANPGGPADVTRNGPRGARLGVLVMAHGGKPEWNDAVRDAVTSLPGDNPVEIAFGMADADSLQAALRRLEARGVRDVAVVRLFVSGESWYERTRQILGLAPGAPERPQTAHLANDRTGGVRDVDHLSGHGDHQENPEPAGHVESGGSGGHSSAFYRIDSSCRFAVSREGLADAPEVEAILVERARALSRDPSREDVLLLAHGPGDDERNARWIAAIDARAEALRRAFPFHSIVVETLREDWPDKRAEAERRIRARIRASLDAGRNPIVIPFRVYGFGPYAEVLEGLAYAADGRGLLPHAAISAWITRQIEALERELASTS